MSFSGNLPDHIKVYSLSLHVILRDESTNCFVVNIYYGSHRDPML